MGYKAVIAEKPSVANEIAKVLGARDRHCEGSSGYIEGNGYQVTWAFGHLVGLKTPEEMGYDNKVLPILPDEWPTKILGRRDKTGKTVTDPGVTKQMKTIERVFRGCDEIIVATDAGREGELIFRYIYEYLGIIKPVRRLWISSLTTEAIREGFDNLHPGSDYDGLNAAAHLRSEADWLIGYNASIALRQATGARQLLSLGRVQTPTLGLICDRYLENKNFKPTPFWKNIVESAESGKHFKAISVKNYPSEEEAQADAVKTSASPTLSVTGVETKRVATKPPLLFDLTSLQRAANNRYSLTADETLRAAQSLYENKYMTYPRTGSCYIPEDVFKTIPALIDKVKKYGIFSAAATELEGGRLCRKSVNDSKVTDHHALLPTGNIPTSLQGNEKKVWELVAGRMLEAFGEDSLSDNTTVTIDGGGVTYKAKGSVLVKAGWKSVWGTETETEQTKNADSDEDNDEMKRLPMLKEGERLKTGPVTTERRTDKPLPFFTDSSLLAEMETCGRRIDDEEAREAMKDVGLGTPATRAATIELLIKRGYVSRDKKKILPTPVGLQIWDMVKGRIVSDVKTTGEWERDLALVEHGKMNARLFDRNIREHTEKIVEDLHQNCRPLVATAGTVNEPEHTCPCCGKKMDNMKFSVLCNPEKGGCGFKVPREVAGKKLPEGALNALCEGKKTPLVKGFTAKSGKKFDAYLNVSKEEKKISFEFSQEVKTVSAEGKTCPCCGNAMQDGTWKLTCSCGFTLSKSYGGIALKANQIDALLAGKSVSLKGMTNKTGKKYDATLTVDKDEKGIKFSFDNNRKK